ncbi:MAG: aldo/keto reductase [Bacteroidales bacterium]|nr:aldo/keto reductase [Bacteroidales bacterium]
MAKDINRRQFLEIAGASVITTAIASTGCSSDKNPVTSEKITTSSNTEIPTDKMTYRINKSTGDKVSLLGYGCMRLPTTSQTSARESEDEIDQEMVNKLTDYAIEHGVNLFDTSPAYCKGKSEHAMGIALSRYPRDKYFVSTKLSNFSPDTQTHDGSIAMYHNSLKELQVDYIDYYLLHGIGMGGLDAFNQRYVNNGLLDFLMEERKAGRIRNLGFSYHGDFELFNYIMEHQDQYKFDFVLYQINYVDWKYSNAEYIYNQLESHGISVLIMEPLLGGRLSKLPQHLAQKLQEKRPEKSIASWAFRFCGSLPNTLSVLSGMTYMEHLQDNILSYSPLEPCSDSELELLQNVAQQFMEFPLIPCTACQYCMPCKYGIDIPGIFAHYNKCVNEGNNPPNNQDPNYAKARRAFLVGYDRSVPKLRQASHCIGCNECVSHCPQGIRIPQKLSDIDAYVEKLKTEKF